MTARLAQQLDAQHAQAEALAGWLAVLPDEAFAGPSVLPAWDVHTLVAHVVLVHRGVGRILATRSELPPLSAADFVSRYAVGAAAIEASTRAVAAEDIDPVAELRVPAPVEVRDTPDRTVVAGPRGPITALDWVTTRVLDVVVHCDDLSRTLPDREPVPFARPALATAVRLLAEMLAERVPGRSVEVRIPPFIAVQAVPGPRHTRGTPPNVVEADPVTWLRVATGRTSFADAVADGTIRSSGGRADLTPYLPLFT